MKHRDCRSLTDLPRASVHSARWSALSNIKSALKWQRQKRRKVTGRKEGRGSGGWLKKEKSGPAERQQRH